MTAGTRLPGTPDPMHFWNGISGVKLAGDAWGDTNVPLVILQRGARRNVDLPPLRIPRRARSARVSGRLRRTQALPQAKGT